jgi:hypothetical protein
MLGTSPIDEHIEAITPVPGIFPFHVNIVFEGGATWSGYYELILFCSGEILSVSPASTTEIYAPKAPGDPPYSVLISAKWLSMFQSTIPECPAYYFKLFSDAALSVEITTPTPG